MIISSRTPEGVPGHCPVCGKRLVIVPSKPLRDAPCPHCGCLVRLGPIPCPACGKKVRQLLWGVNAAVALLRIEARKKALLGGQLRPEGAPDWVCLACEPGWSQVHRLALEEEDYQLREGQALAFEGPAAAERWRERHSQVRQAMRELVIRFLES